MSSSSSSGPATTVWWAPNQIFQAQVDTITLASVNPGAVITVTVGIAPNTGVLLYTAGSTNTTTEASGLASALAAIAATDPRFAEISFAASNNTIICTAVTAGTPHTLSVGQLGGASISIATTTPNLSPSDVNDPLNWNRSGVQQLPQNGDTVIVTGQSVPLLWNLDKLATVQFASYNRWQDFIGTIGLPDVNPAGYVEYRPTYFQFSGPPGGNLQLNLGLGQTGSGPTRERYNTGNQQTTLNLFASGAAQDAYAVRFLGSNAFNVVNVYASSLGVATGPGETATVQTGTILNGGAATFGSGCTFSGTLTVNAATAFLFDAPGAVLAQSGATVTVETSGLTYPSITAKSGSTVTWLSNSGIASLVLQTGSVFDKSQDARNITITNSTQDGDTTSVRDNWSAITWTNPITFANAVAAGPALFGPGRTVKIT